MTPPAAPLRVRCRAPIAKGCRGTPEAKNMLRLAVARGIVNGGYSPGFAADSDPHSSPSVDAQICHFADTACFVSPPLASEKNCGASRRSNMP
jgi:hypothetical protein